MDTDDAVLLRSEPQSGKTSLCYYMRDKAKVHPSLRKFDEVLFLSLFSLGLYINWNNEHWSAKDVSFGVLQKLLDVASKLAYCRVTQSH